MPTIVHPQPANREMRLMQRIVALEERVAAMERAGAQIPTGAAPAAGSGRDGAIKAQSDTLRIWVRINGVWRYTPLT